MKEIDENMAEYEVSHAGEVDLICKWYDRLRMGVCVTSFLG